MIALEQVSKNIPQATEACLALLKVGASNNQDYVVKNFGLLHKNIKTPIELAAEQGHFKIVKLITEKMIINNEDLTLAKKALVSYCVLKKDISSLFSFAFESSNNQIFEALRESLYVISKNAITQHLEDLKIQKATSPYFYNSDDDKRANIYLNLLENRNIYETAVILLALFSYDEGRPFKEHCGITFGFNSPTQAKSHFLNLIKKEWDSEFDANLVKLSQIIGGIVFAANSGKTIPIEKLNAIFESLMASEIDENKANQTCNMM